MKIVKDGIVLDPKKNKEKIKYAPDELVDKVSRQISEEYSEALQLLAKESGSIKK